MQTKKVKGKDIRTGDLLVWYSPSVERCGKHYVNKRVHRINLYEQGRLYLAVDYQDSGAYGCKGDSTIGLNDECEILPRDVPYDARWGYKDSLLEEKDH